MSGRIAIRPNRMKPQHCAVRRNLGHLADPLDRFSAENPEHTLSFGSRPTTIRLLGNTEGDHVCGVSGPAQQLKGDQVAGTLSEKVLRILRSRADLTEDRLEKLTEAEAWRLVDALPKPSTKPQRLSVCFTGFSQVEKRELMGMAISANHHVASSVTKSLGLLVYGENAVSKELEQATGQGVALITGAAYRALLQASEGGSKPADG